MGENASELAVAVLLHLREEFEDIECIALYQIGSSVLGGSWTFNDLDVLFVDYASPRGMFRDALKALQEAIREGRPHQGTFTSTDEESQGCVMRAVNKAQAMTGDQIEVRTEFSFGPLKREPRRDELVLHVCGPLGLEDLTSLAEYLPFHTLAFLAKNRAILGPPLSSILPRPQIGSSEFLQWLSALLRIEGGNAPVEYKLKARRKAALCFLLYKGDKDAYEKVDELSRRLDILERPQSEDLLSRFEEAYRSF